MTLIIEVKVVPQSKKQRCILDKQERLKCFLKNPPERGKANKEICILFAQVAGVTQEDVTILSGATSRIKRMKIDNTSKNKKEIFIELGIEQQLNIDNV